MAQDERWADLYIEDAEVEQGATSVVLKVCMKNSENAASGWATSVCVPDGFSIAKVVRGSRAKLRDEEDEYIFIFEYAPRDFSSNIDSCYIQSYTTQDVTFKDVDGDIALVTVNIPLQAQVGEYDIVMKECEVGYSSSVISSYNEITSKLTIKLPTKVGTMASSEIQDGKFLIDNKLVIRKNLLEYHSNGVEQ